MKKASKKPLTNEQKVKAIMIDSNYGPWAQIFVMDALNKLADKVIASKIEDYPKNGFVNPELWIAVAHEVKEKLK